MNVLIRIWQSSLGKKYLMALTGSAMMVFLFFHLVGNLQVFVGETRLNTHAFVLHHFVELLWPLRIALLAMLVIHVVAAVKLSAENRAARPVAYSRAEQVTASYASRTMLMSGLLIALFIVYHLLHFTFQVSALNFTGRSFQEFHGAAPAPLHAHNVYRMVLAGLGQPLVAGFYLLSLALLFLHLSHGMESWFQTLGLTFECCPSLPKILARVMSLFFFVGYSSMPIAIQLDKWKIFDLLE
jgi:succinate dehydrogenase / fumarate reductase cytochrome b subunit